MNNKANFMRVILATAERVVGDASPPGRTSPSVRAPQVALDPPRLVNGNAHRASADVGSGASNYVGDPMVSPPAMTGSARSTIEYRPGERARIVAELAQALARTGQYYSRDSAVVRISRLPTVTIEKCIQRAAGSVVLRCADASAIVADVSSVASIVKRDMRSNKLRAIDLPRDVALSLISVGAENPAIQPILGIVHCPIVRANGDYSTAEGYDAVSGLYLESVDDLSSLDVREQPTREEAQEAARWLIDEIYGEFDFVGEIDKAVALSSVLTSVLRPTFGTAPVHCFDAPGHGLGKSLLAEIAGIVALGFTPPLLPVGETKEETMKRVGSAILAGDPIVVIDNVSEPLAGDELCVAMTAGTVKVRPLGSSNMLNVPSRAFWMVTGANLRISKDMVRRAVVCRIDASVEHPERRTFKKADLKAWVKENRAKVISKVLTILRAHAQYGFPSGAIDAPPLGNFEQWSRRVANCLLWLGYANPVASQARLYEDDPVRIRDDAVLGALLNWQETAHFRNTQRAYWQWSDVRAAVSVAHDGPAAELRDAINDAFKHGISDFPYWLRGARDRIINGKRLIGEKDPHTKSMRWKVERVKAAEDAGDRG
jgi:putative DNA primase/helicase